MLQNKTRIVSQSIQNRWDSRALKPGRKGLFFIIIIIFYFLVYYLFCFGGGGGGGGGEVFYSVHPVRKEPC